MIQKTFLTVATTKDPWISPPFASWDGQLHIQPQSKLRECVSMWHIYHLVWP